MCSCRKIEALLAHPAFARRDKEFHKNSNSFKTRSRGSIALHLPVCKDDCSSWYVVCMAGTAPQNPVVVFIQNAVLPSFDDFLGNSLEEIRTLRLFL